MIAKSRTSRRWTCIAPVLVALLAAPGAAEDKCQLCHRDVAVQFKTDVHALDFTCIECHGGDSTTTAIAAAHAGDFRPPPPRPAIPTFCAGCHADPERMHPYGLPIDQYALYQTSGHGRALARQNESAAICTDCHGTHGIRSKGDPASPTHRRNIAATCGGCHGEATAAHSGAVVKDYQASVHAAALQSGNVRAPECVDCHGSHGAAPPGVGAISTVCSHCHRRTAAFFRAGPHQQGMAKNGQEQCAACHGNHRILAATPALWTSVCTDCHDSNSEAVRTGDKIQTLLTQTQRELEKARRAVERARLVPLDVSDYEARLSTAANYLIEVQPLAHSLDLGVIEDEMSKARSIAREVEGEIHEQIRVFEGRKFFALFFWLYILITLLAIHYYKRHAR